MDDIMEKQTQVNARLSVSDKLILITLAKSKGVEGITGLLKLLARAQEVKIKL